MRVEIGSSVTESSFTLVSTTNSLKVWPDSHDRGASCLEAIQQTCNQSEQRNVWLTGCKPSPCWINDCDRLITNHGAEQSVWLRGAAGVSAGEGRISSQICVDPRRMIFDAELLAVSDESYCHTVKCKLEIRLLSLTSEIWRELQSNTLWLVGIVFLAYYILRDKTLWPQN